MDLLIVGLGIIAGGISYLVVQFWMNPLLRFIDIKHQVTSDMVFYANAINAEGMNDEFKKRHATRKEQNRKHAAELRASFYRLPWWYKRYLQYKKEDTVRASKSLIGLSNTSEYDLAYRYTEDLRRSLGIPEDMLE